MGQGTRLTRAYDDRLRHCPLCASEDLRAYDVDFRGNRIDKCAACGLKFLNPQHSDEYLRELYGGYTELPMDRDEISSARHAWRRSIHSYYLGLVERYTVKGRMLSVGSGDGVEIDAAIRAGWITEAYEYDESVSRFLADALSVHTWVGEFAEIPCEPESYDCVYLHQVLEHPKRPQDYLRKIHAILKPGGVVFIACPNIESPSAKWKTLLGRTGLKKHRGRHYDTWHHLFYYSPSVLKTALETHYGFDVVHIRSGLGERLRGTPEAALRRSMVWDGILPVWRSVFVLIARKR